MATMILDFGKCKGHQISECDTKYLQWLVSHERVLAVRNRWASRDAKFELARRSQEIAQVAVVEVAETVAPKQNYRIISLGHKKERRDFVGELTQKAEDKRNLLAECREIKARSNRSADLGLKGNFGNRGFQLMR
jgi:hypothetical protein